MKTFYAIASRFGGAGIGRTASHGAMGLWRAGALSWLCCLGHEKTAIDESIISDIYFPPGGALPLLSDKQFYEMKNRWFDFRCRMLLDERYDTFHCWNSQANLSLKKAKSLGIAGVVDRASSHILTQNKILCEQYEKHGIRYNPTYDFVIKRCLEDYEIADFVVTPSPFAYASFAHQGFDMSKVLYNPFGVDLSRFSPRKKAPDRFQVTFIGQIGIRKGVLNLLAAWDKLGLSDGKLVLAGEPETMIKDRISKWKGREDIEFTGFVSDVEKLLHETTVFAFPSCEEGSALVTYEAMACGVPLVVTKNAGSVAVDNESAIFVEMDNPEQLAGALERFYKEPALSDEMGQNARIRVETFPWSAYQNRTARMHEAIYKKLPKSGIQKAMGVDAPDFP